jgi:hypothetical protein
MEDVAEITGVLSSEKLLTNSKKELIMKKIQATFFSLSGVVFLLYRLLEKSKKNREELEKYSGEVEYE